MVPTTISTYMWYTIVAFDNVPYGEYEIMELETVSGYNKTDEVFSISITEDGKTVTIEIGNEKIPENPILPQTGDTSNVALWIFLMGTSAAGLAVNTVTGKRMKRKAQ